MGIKLSVIVPVYNREDCIERCIKSIIGKNLNEFEILIINDGSTDKTENILEKLRDKYKFLKVYKISNHGVSYARNYGVNKAKGDYVIFVDSDDYLDDYSIDILLNEINLSEKIDVYIYNIKIKSIKGIIIKGDIDKNIILKKDDIKENIIPKMIFNTEMLNSPCNKVYNLNFIKTINAKFPINLKRGEDLEFNRVVISNSSNIKLIAKSVYTYNLTSNSAMRSEVKNYKEIYHSYYNNTLNFIKNNNLDFKYFSEKLYKVMINFIIIDLMYNSSIYLTKNISEIKYKVRDILQDKINNEIIKGLDCKKVNNKDRVLFKLIKNSNYKLISVYLVLNYRYCSIIKKKIRKLIINSSK